MDGRLVFFGLIVGVLLLGGCLSVSNTSTQTFSEDGSSVLEISEKTGLTNSGSSYTYNYDDSYYENNPSMLASKLMMDYYGSVDYATDTCALMSGVESCTPQSDGSVNVKVNLTPGTFYSFDSSFDFANLKQVRTYTIDKVPMAEYFALKGKTTDTYKSLMTNYTKAYVEKNIDKYLTRDYYCGESYGTFGCKIGSFSGGTLIGTLNMSSYYSSNYVIKWVGCTSTDPDYIGYYNDENNTLDMVQTPVYLNKTISGYSPITLSVPCSSDSKGLVIAYTYDPGYYSASSYYNSTYYQNQVSISAMKISTREGKRQEILDSLKSTQSSYSYYSTYLPASVSDYMLDFKKGKVLGQSIDDILQAGTGSSYYTGSSYKPKVDLSYSAAFPQKITSAELDGDRVDTSGKGLSLELADLEGKRGSLVVVAESQLSPLGSFTWLALVVVVGLAYFVFLRKGPTP